MHPIVVGAIVAVFSNVVIIGFLYWRYGFNMSTRLCLYIGPTMGLVAVDCIWIGMRGARINDILLISCFNVPALAVSMLLVSRKVIAHLRVQVELLTSAGTQVAAAARQAATTAAEQVTSVSEVTSTIGELRQMSRFTDDSARQVLTVTGDAVERGKEGLRSLSDSLAVLDRIRQVEQIVEVVDELANQSNLLAINASIEAAKAGEFGRGFAVVASEVRRLSELSRKAVRQISEAINRTEEGQRSVEVANTTMKELARVLADAADRSRQISGAAAQQSAGAQQIADAMDIVSRGGQDNAAAARHLEEASNNLVMVGDKLHALIQTRTAGATATA